MNESNTQNDHDSITRLVSDVRNIKEGQDKFHVDQRQFRTEITVKLDKMIDSYVTQADHVEVVRVQRIHDTEIKDLQSFKDTLIGKLWGVGLMAGFGSGLLMMGIQYFINHR